MLQLVKIGTNSPYYGLVEEIMHSAFPICERRNDQHQKDITDCANAFSCNAIVKHSQFVGILNYWHLDWFCFVEHFAIDKQFQSQGLGTEALSIFTNTCKIPIILEVEKPKTQQAIRRIEFYQRNGFVAWSDSNYIQPTYRPNGEWVPMTLMAHGKINEHRHFSEVKRTIHQKVYGVE